MIFIGLLTWIGLSILGVPLALTLGLIAALLSFVPNFGPIIAAVPALLLAFIDSPIKASKMAGIADIIGPKFGIKDKSPAISPSVKASGTRIIESPIHVSKAIKIIEPALPISHQRSV